MLSKNTISRKEVVTLGMCGENSLFTGHIGDWTWDTVARLCNVNPYTAKNNNGEPTYLSFCYYNIEGHGATHLRSFGIGSEIEVVSSVYKCDSVSLHTIHRIGKVSQITSEPVTIEEVHDYPQPNCLYIENYNRWISRTCEDNNELLSKMQPQNYKYEHLPQIPDKYVPWKVYRKAITNNTFFDNKTGYDLISQFSTTSEVNIARDINGVGLLYFAAYFNIFDEAILMSWLSLGGDKRSFLHKKIIDQKICYLGNCNYDTNLNVETTVWKKNNNYAFSAVISRCSDRETIAIVTAHIQIEIAIKVKDDREESSVLSHESKSKVEPATIEKHKYVAPSSDVEKKIAAMWQELLNVDNVGINDNFFRLGGHSLLAFNFIFDVQKAFGVNISLKHLSSDKTLKTIANQISSVIDNKSQETTLAQITKSLVKHEPFLLTEIQQAYLIGRNEALEMGKVATHFYMELKCDLSLDLTKLNDSWQQLIHRHEMLRAIVVEDRYQKVLTEVPTYKIVEKDLSSLHVNEQNIVDVRHEMSHQVFTPSKWPLFDIRVTKTSSCYYLHISIDFLMTDARSLQILFNEWQQLYKGNAQLAPLQITFCDYLHAEKNTHHNLHQISKNYWQKRIATLPFFPQLPFVKSVRESEQRFYRHCFRLSSPKWLNMQKKAEQQGFTASVVLLAMFGEILARWSRNLHFILNLTLFNRLPLHPEVDFLIGDFTSSLLLEMDYTQRQTLQQRAHEVFQQLLSDLDHRYYSGVEVIRDVNSAQKKPGDIVAPVVFTSTIGLAKNGFCPTHFGEENYFVTQTSQAWLDCFVYEENNELVVNWFYVKDLFPPQLIDSMFENFQMWVEKFCDEDLWQKEVDIALPQDQIKRRKSLYVAKPISDDLLHTLFIKQANKFAHNPAVIFGNTTLTYNELYKKSCAIAHKLQQMNVKTNELVAIVMEKGHEQVIAAMGILFSGAAYLPISPDLPQERINYLLENAHIVLTQSYIRDKFTFSDTKIIVNVDTFVGDTSEVQIIQKKQDLAYVIYTSGSTGFPKGVAISHEAAVNTIIDINDRFNVTSKDRVLALSALNFDLSVYDIFGILAAGGCIVIPPSKSLREPRDWQQLMEKYDVTLWNTVPALMQMFVDSQLQTNSPMRIVMLSGDWIPLTLPSQIKAQWPNSQIISLGGATEASIWSICYPIEKVDPSWKSIPYGKPLTNQCFFVLNEKWQDCPDWVAGELFIGGLGVAQKYWNAPEITQKSFVYHPQSGEKLYRTGDLGRYLPDGNIEFLGREDSQVKIHGYRIELGEIETHLSKHPVVEEAIVDAVENNGEKQLTAYVKSKVLALELKLENKNTRPVTSHHTKLSSCSYNKEKYLERQSYRIFKQDVITKSSLSQLLACLLGVRLPGHSIYKYRYPSARGLYPVQTYLYVKPDKVQQLRAGFYYYHPIENYLELLSENPLTSEIYAKHNHSIFDSSAFALFFIAHLDAIRPIYGNISSQLCLLEAGYMGQLLMNCAVQCDIGLCPVDILAQDFSKISTNFKLGKNDLFLHGFLAGKIDAQQKQEWQQQPLQKKSSLEQISEFLQHNLPHYMLPKHYVFVDSFPLNANGKVDKSQLPQPKLQNAQQVSLPQTSIEKEIAQIWQQVLNVDYIHLNSHFFDLGGHSINAIAIFREIEQKLQISLPVATLFQHPTLRELTDVISKKYLPEQSKFECLVPIQVSSQGEKNLFMVHTLHGYVVEFYKVAENMDKEFNVYGFQSIGVDGKKLPLTSIKEMATIYIQELKIVQPKGPYYIAGRCMGGVIAYEIAQQLSAQGEKVDLLCLIETSNVPGMEGYKDFTQREVYRQKIRKSSRIKSIIKKVFLPHKIRNPRAEIISFLQKNVGFDDRAYRKKIRDANAKALDQYTIKPYQGFLCLIYSAKMSRGYEIFREVCKNCKYHIVKSNHFNILLEPHVQKVAKIITDYMKNDFD